MTASDQHASLFESQLPLHSGLPAFQQVVDLGPEPSGDHAQDTGGRLASPKLDLVEKGSTEIATAHLGEAHATVVTEAPDALAERLHPRHRGIIPDVKLGFTVASGAGR